MAVCKSLFCQDCGFTQVVELRCFAWLISSVPLVSTMQMILINMQQFLFPNFNGHDLCK